MYSQKVGINFVREYYKRLSLSPSTLHELYSEKASFVHGNEGDHEQKGIVRGKEGLEDLLNREDFAFSKVRITDVSSVPTLDSSISVLVMGDIKSGDSPSKMFIQSFVLSNSGDKGPLVVTDILRYPQQEASDDCSHEEPESVASAKSNEETKKVTTAESMSRGTSSDNSKSTSPVAASSTENSETDGSVPKPHSSSEDLKKLYIAKLLKSNFTPKNMVNNFQPPFVDPNTRNFQPNFYYTAPPSYYQYPQH